MPVDAARVQVRPWQAGDADALHRLVRASHPSLSTWLPWCHADYGLDDARGWIDHSLARWHARSAFPFAVIDADAGTLLGSTGLSQLDGPQKTANLGYWVGTPFVGAGIATEAARQAARFGFDEMGLQRIVIRALPDNHASLAVARKLGARYESTVQDRAHGHGSHDILVHVLTAGDIA